MIKCSACGALYLGKHVCDVACAYCGQRVEHGKFHACAPAGMIYCNMCKQTVPMRHVCPIPVQSLLGKTVEASMKPKARNFVVIGEKDQGNPPTAVYFDTYQEAEDYAVRRARERDTGYDVYRLSGRAFIRPQAPVINKVVPGDDDR